MSNLVEVHDLNVRFTGERTVYAVNGVNLTLGEGEVVGLLVTGRFGGRAEDLAGEVYEEGTGIRKRRAEEAERAGGEAAGQGGSEG